MASIKSASKRRREGGKIYVSGYVDGLETGYNYCIMYSYNDGPTKNMGHGGMSYTFISLASLPKGSSKRYSFTDTNSWVPDDGDGTYKIICNMVGGRCEDVHVQESSRSFSVAAPYTPPPTPEPEPTPYTPPPAAPICNEGETMCEYNEAHNRHMVKKCVNGRLVFDRWCGTDDTCERGVCITPPKPEPTPAPPACEEGAIVCEYHEGQQRYLLKKCVNGKLVFEKWCGASDTCEGGVCVSATHGVVPIVTPTDEKKYLSEDAAAARINTGLPCYIKCVLPILDLLPGIPYTPGMWIPPFCAITTKP